MKVPGGVVSCVSFRDLVGRVGPENPDALGPMLNTIKVPRCSPSAMRRQLVKAGKRTRCFSRNWFGRPRGGSRPRGSWLPDPGPLGVVESRGPLRHTCAHSLFWSSCPSHLPFPAAQGAEGVAAAGTHPLSTASVAAALSILVSLPLGSPFLNGLRRTLLIQSGRWG